MIKKSTEVTKTRVDTLYLIGKALSITYKLVFIPILLLFSGLFIDKKLDTTPLFIIIGFVAGLVFAVFKALHIKKHLFIE
jgi:F0F1-type ATP synthase assembly protein I